MRRYLLLLPFVLSPVAQAMQALDDASLSGVSGQDGISLEIVGGGWTASSVNYSQDGQTLSLKDVSSGPQTAAVASTTTIDAVGDQLQIEHHAAPSVLSVGNIEMAGSSNSFGNFRAFYTLGASLKLKGGGASGVSGFAVDDSALSLSDVTFYYRDNGFDLIVKGASFDVYLNDVYLDIVGGGSGQEIKLDLGNSRLVANIGAIGLDLAHGDPIAGVAVTPSTPDTRDPSASRSFGKLNMDLRLGGSISIASGGASGEGLRIKPNVTISNSLFQYQDEGVLRAENFAGTLSSTSGLTFDLNFIDDGLKQNWLKLRPGGDVNSGLKGLSADLSWNMANSSVSLTDNGNSMWFSGLRTHGTGLFTLDLTKSCAAGISASCYAGTQSDMSKGNYNGHFDGLRLGLNNVKGSYSFDGLRVGSATAPLQGGTELLVLMEIFPAYDFTLNGQLTLQPGGSIGDGVRYNADFYVTEAKAAITVDETGKGLWLSGTTYDMHYRDGSLDISNGGVELRKGTYWSKLDVADVRWGDRNTGTSLRRLVLKRYEQGSTLALSSGGSGALCVGGSGSSASACSAGGGRWEDRGNEGVSVKLKSVFVRDTTVDSSVNGVATDEKRNQVLWETNRTAGNGTGA